MGAFSLSFLEPWLTRVKTSSMIFENYWTSENWILSQGQIPSLIARSKLNQRLKKALQEFPSVFGGHFIICRTISLLEKMRDFRPIPP